MNKVMLLFLSLSVSGSVLALFLFLIKPLIKNRLGQTWQYYIWLVVVLRFLLPFTPQISLVGELSQRVQSIAESPAIVGVSPSAEINEEALTPQLPETATPSPALEEIPQTTGAEVTFWSDILNNIWLLWIGVALVLFVHKVVSYRSFVRFIRIGSGTEKTTDEHTLALYHEELAAAKIKGRLPLYQNKQASSPMLIGILRPALVIPALETSDEELRSILRHELTHYKRLDFLYKWLTQIMLCLHWFNPLVYLISKQINKNCELSCDEAVIRNADKASRITYGNALLVSLTAQGSYSDFVASMTMSENGKIVKERLDMIMGVRRKSVLATCATALLTVFLLCGFAFAGAYAGASASVAESAAAPKSVSTTQLQTIKTISLTATDCNVILRHSVNDQFLYDYNETNNTISSTTTGTNLAIKATRTGGQRNLESLTEMIVIYVPDRSYDEIIVESDSSGVNLSELELNTNLRVTSHQGSVSASVQEGFNKSISITSQDGSGVLAFEEGAKDYLLNISPNGSGVTVPSSFPAFTPERDWDYQNGNGAAKITLDLKGSAFAIVDDTEKFPSDLPESTRDYSGDITVETPLWGENTIEPPVYDTDLKGQLVINLDSNGQNSLLHSSSFQAKAGQVLTLQIKSNIEGTVDLFLISPDSKEQRITIGGSDATEIITLSEGTWAYNCTGFFESGEVSILGAVTQSREQLPILEEPIAGSDLVMPYARYNPNVELEVESEELPAAPSFSYEKIEAGKVVCIGQIELTSTLAYRLSVSVDEGSGLFVGLHRSGDKINSTGTAFEQRFGTPDHSISAYFDSSNQAGTYYVYVGSGHEGTELINVNGTLSHEDSTSVT